MPPDAPLGGITSSRRCALIKASGTSRFAKVCAGTERAVQKVFATRLKLAPTVGRAALVGPTTTTSQPPPAAPFFADRACLGTPSIPSQPQTAAPAQWLSCMRLSPACGVPRDHKFVPDACTP